jgi:hypothetical protein
VPSKAGADNDRAPWGDEHVAMTEAGTAGLDRKTGCLCGSVRTALTRLSQPDKF